MNIFGKEEEEPQSEDTKVISNSLGIDLGTLNTVIAKPSGDKFDLYQIPSVVAVKKDDPSAVLAVGEEAKKMFDEAGIKLRNLEFTTDEIVLSFRNEDM